MEYKPTLGDVMAEQRDYGAASRESDRHDRHEPGKLTVDEALRFARGLKELMCGTDDKSDLTRKEAKQLIANAQPTLDNLKDIKGV